MGWTIHYEATCRDREEPSAEERDILQRHIERWAPRLHPGSEPYNFNEELREVGVALVGRTKIQGSERPLADLVTVIEAVRELEQALPNFTFRILDDYYFTNWQQPSDVDLEELRNEAGVGEPR